MPDMRDDQRLRDELVRLLTSLPYGGMSKLARDVGVKPASVRLWREGQNVPRPPRWKAIERHLGLDDGHLASFVDDYRTGPAITQPGDVGRLEFDELTRVVRAVALRVSESLDGDESLSELADALESERTARLKDAQ